MKRIVPILVLALAAHAVAACKPAVVPVRSLLEHPAQYDRKTVAVVGRVKNQVGVMGWAAYEIEDSTGVVTVATKQFGAPLAGIQMGLQGEFRARMAFDEGARPAIIETRRWNAGPHPLPAPAPAESLSRDTV